MHVFCDFLFMVLDDDATFIVPSSTFSVFKSQNKINILYFEIEL